MAAKQILFRLKVKAKQVALEMNPNMILLDNYCTFGRGRYFWRLSDDAVYIAFTSGQGKIDGRFAQMFLIKGSAEKINFYGEVVDKVSINN